MTNENGNHHIRQCISTGISILIKIRYSTNPITQITAFSYVNRFACRLSARFTGRSLQSDRRSSVQIQNPCSTGNR